MVLYCVVPQCEPHPDVAIHPFPENEALKLKWVLQIPAENRVIQPDSGVCALHFPADDLSVPSIFQEATSKPSRAFNSLFDLAGLLEEEPHALPPSVLRISKPQFMVFYTASFDPKTLPEMEYALYVYYDLSFSLHHKTLHKEDLLLNNRPSKLNSFQELLDMLSALDKLPAASGGSLNKAIELLKDVKDSPEKKIKLDFLREQLEMLSTEPDGRQYSLNTLTSACVWKNRCSSLYEMLGQFLTLPNVCLSNVEDEARDLSIAYLKTTGFVDNMEFKKKIRDIIAKDGGSCGDLLCDTFMQLWNGEIEEFETKVCWVVFILLKELYLNSRSSHESSTNSLESDKNDPSGGGVPIDEDDSVEMSEEAPNDDTLFECTICQEFVAWRLDGVLSHCKSSHSGENVVFKVRGGPAIMVDKSLAKFTCENCTSSSLEQLNDHLYEHAQKKALKCRKRNCPACNTPYESFPELKSHYEKQHSFRERSLYECQKCGEIFSECALYLRHKMTAHINEPKSFMTPLNVQSVPTLFSCTICRKTFGKKRYLAKHRARVHSHSLAFSCESCGKKFATNEYLREHIKTRHSPESLPYSKHSGNPEKYPCEFCKKSFMNKSFLSNHVDIVHNGLRLYSCSSCGKSCSNSHNLKLHERQHGLSMDSFICGVCGNVFASQLSLKDHVNNNHAQNI